MKTLRLEMLTARILLGMVTPKIETTGRKHLRDRIYLSFDEAMKDPALVLALYQQTNAATCNHRTPFSLNAAILGDLQYIVMGSCKEWKWFYGAKWEYLLRACPCAISIN